MITKAQQRATSKYRKKTYYCPAVFIKKEYEDTIKKRASDLGMTVSSYIISLILKDLGK